VVGVLCRTARGELVAFQTSQVVLATGGAGQIYRETTNPTIATGDGVAMGLRAGARVRDLEFVQFHPTCLYIAGAARVLISEVVRGAGGVLRDREGVRFMPDYHPAAELAPRDVVSRAVFERMVATEDTSVYLDLADLDRDPHQAFPYISKICRFFGIDIARDPIPVRPGCHYLVGGLAIDAEGRTSVPGLWAAGECASSGLHGANRMGSNSLLEGMVLGEVTGAAAARESDGRTTLPPVPGVGEGPPAPPTEVNVADLTYSLKSLMWRQLGVARAERGLRDALDKLRFWRRAVRALPLEGPRSWELANMLTLAHLITLGASVREESRGVHYRTDHPEPRDEWRAHLAATPRVEDGAVHAVELASEPLTEAVSSA
jgi:L-aspartate oxidase